jgi:hypothetical protein
MSQKVSFCLGFFCIRVHILVYAGLSILFGETVRFLLVVCVQENVELLYIYIYDVYVSSMHEFGHASSESY